jgi:hypothetical protein
MISEERFKEIRDYVMKSTLTEGFEDPLHCASPIVYKRLVVGYLIIKTVDARVISRPVCQSSDYCDCDNDIFNVCTFLNDGEELLSVVPATKMTFAVYLNVSQINFWVSNLKEWIILIGFKFLSKN